jgi:hypothetical protein
MPHLDPRFDRASCPSSHHIPAQSSRREELKINLMKPILSGDHGQLRFVR